MLDQQKITIIYCRLSVEDIKEDVKGGKADESNSIQNQKEYLSVAFFHADCMTW